MSDCVCQQVTYLSNLFISLLHLSVSELILTLPTVPIKVCIVLVQSKVSASYFSHPKRYIVLQKERLALLAKLKWFRGRSRRWLSLCLLDLLKTLFALLKEGLFLFGCGEFGCNQTALNRDHPMSIQPVTLVGSATCLNSLLQTHVRIEFDCVQTTSHVEHVTHAHFTHHTVHLFVACGRVISCRVQKRPTLAQTTQQIWIVPHFGQLFHD